MTDPKTPLLLVGGGKMGSALVAGWLDRGLDPGLITVVEPNADAAAKLPVTVISSTRDLPTGYIPGLILFAVKPQVMAEVVQSYAGLSDFTVYLSIAAGKPIRFFEGLLGENAAVARAMPNTPAAIGRGITALCANDKTTEEEKSLCADLLSAVGDTVWVDDEALMDAVTAVSGSGPAYVFLLAEALAEAGIAAGLPADTAQQLARATVSGAGELLARSADSAAELRVNVTSPGGTTAAALDVLMGDGGLAPLMRKAVAAATARGRELAE